LQVLLVISENISGKEEWLGNNDYIHFI
jgi:hypothetical protein